MSLLSKIKNNFEVFWGSAGFSNRVNTDLYPVFAPSPFDILKTIDSYWVSRFVYGDFDENGMKRPFLNISKLPVFVAGKMIDINTKEIRVIPEGMSSPLYAYFFGIELSEYMERIRLSKLLNDGKWLLPKYGTLVAKKVVDDSGVSIKFVPLINLRNDSRAAKLENSHFIGEIITLSVPKFKKLAELRGWDKLKVNLALDSASDGNITIIEYYGEIEGENGNFFQIVDDGTDDGILLDKGVVSEPPYKDLHWDKVDGRYLGISQVENTFEAQIHLNWVQELKARGLHWTSKHIYQSEDETIDRNLFNDVEDGDVFHVRRPISPIPVEERNLHAYQEEESVWLAHSQRANMVQDILLGAQKSGIPLGSTIIQAQMAGNFFENKRQEYGDFIKEILWDWVIPEFKRSNRAEHILNMTNADPQKLQLFADLVVQERVRKRAGVYLSQRGYLPNSDALEVFKSFEREKILQKPIFKIPEGVYDNLQFKIKLVVTGESADLSGKLQAIQIALQTTQDPQERVKLQNRLLQLIGEEPNIEPPQSSLLNVFEQRASQPRVRMPQSVPSRISQETTL